MPPVCNQRQIMQQACRRRFFLVFIIWRMQQIRHEYWVHPINELRFKKGEFYTLYPDLRHFPHKFFNMYRMTVAKLDTLLEKVDPVLRRQWTNMREPISPEQKLVITLR